VFNVRVFSGDEDAFSDDFRAPVLRPNNTVFNVRAFSVDEDAFSASPVRDVMLVEKIIGMDTKVWSNSNRMSREYRSFRCCHRRNNRSLPPNSFVRGDSAKTRSSP